MITANVNLVFLFQVEKKMKDANDDFSRAFFYEILINLPEHILKCVPWVLCIID